MTLATTATANKRGADRVVRKLLSSLKPSPENDTLYDRNDAAIVELAGKLAAAERVDPLVVTADNYIVSGHRRYAAYTRLGRVKVQCQVLSKKRSDYTRDEYVKLLREYNRQRDKSVAEKVRETMVDLDTDDAYRSLRASRDKSVNAAAHNGMRPIAIEGSKRRSEISEDKADHVKYILQVVNERKAYWPLSVRGVHYPLLNFPFIRGYYHPKKKDPDYGNGPRTLWYANDDGSYDATSDLCTRLRLDGQIPWEALHDPTRPVQEFRPFRNAQEFVKQEVDNLFSGYWRDLLQSQPNHFEVLVEKNTVYHMAQQVTRKYQITTRSARGLNSIDSFHEIAEAFQDSGREKLILIVLSDYDPEGELIPHDAGRRLRDDFDIPIEDIEVYKAGVTRGQIAKYKIPVQNVAKEKSSNYDWFVDRNGGDESVYELEALDPKDMLADLDRVIRNVLDIDLYNAEAAEERKEAPYLEASKRTVREALNGLR